MSIVMQDGRVTLHHGDSREVLRQLSDSSIDSVCTDPPYALVSISKRFSKTGRTDTTESKSDAHQRFARGFMGKTWDSEETAFATTFWAQVMRVLKPGGHVLAFGGTRTYHRLACAIEDAGFEIRDQIGWAYGSGFPKSHNQSGEWEGWGTALKPAWEPIVVARKPLDGTVAGNLAEWGVGALNIDGCRVEATGGDEPLKWERGRGMGFHGAEDRGPCAAGIQPLGRWPANIIHDGSDEVLAAFPDTKSGVMKAGTMRAAQDEAGSVVYGVFGGRAADQDTYGDSGSAARFFYCAKASRADRDAGLDHLPKTNGGHIASKDGGGGGWAKDSATNPNLPRANTHPTVKPTDLMRYLCRLVTPSGGVVLDPFMGSGSTGKAAVLEGFQFVGIEREDEYVPIAAARIAWAVGHLSRPDVPTPKAKKSANDNAPDMFSAIDDYSETPVEIADAEAFG